MHMPLNGWFPIGQSHRQAAARIERSGAIDPTISHPSDFVVAFTQMVMICLSNLSTCAAPPVVQILNYIIQKRENPRTRHYGAEYDTCPTDLKKIFEAGAATYRRRSDRKMLPR